MGAHNGSGGSEKKNEANDLQTFSAENLQSNMKVVYYSRTFLSIIGGVIAGILGFTGLNGFIFYFLIMATTSIGLLAKAKFSVHSYFDSWNQIILDGFVGGLMWRAMGCTITSSFGISGFFHILVIFFKSYTATSVNHIFCLVRIVLLMSFVLFWTFAYDIVHIF